MRVGVVVTSYNSGDWERLLAGDYSRPPAAPDAAIVDDTIAFGDLVEPLGFDSIWTSEHWGSPYSMQGDPLQWLSYWVGRTERVDVGTGVLVLPWWDPVRLAHEIAVLDILLGERRFLPGVGRGVTPHEYGSLRIPLEESRERFYEVLDVLRLAETEEAFEYDGEHYKIPLTAIRPQARHKGHLLDDVRGAFTTPRSAEMAANAGLGQMFVAGESLSVMTERAALHNQIRVSKGLEAAQTTAMLFTRCVPDTVEAEEAGRYVKGHMSDGRNHYLVWKNEGFEGVRGYEDWEKKFTEKDGDASHQRIAETKGTQLVGAPEQIIEKIEAVNEAIGMDELVIHVNHGGIPLKEAIESLELFAAEVLPIVHEMAPAPPRMAKVEAPVA